MSSYIEKVKSYYSSNDCKFTVLGGVLIGSSATANFLLQGRITGLSGMFNSIITLKGGLYWVYPFFTGLLLTTYGSYKYFGSEINIFGKKLKVFDTPSETSSGISNYGFLLGGLLVGLGTKVGNGCTSGHAVCGLGRLSKRSLVATLTFMTTGIITATLREFIFKTEKTEKNNLKEEKNEEKKEVLDKELYNKIGLGFLGSSLIVSAGLMMIYGSHAQLSFIQGGIFGLGLMISGMCRRSKVKGFLTMDSNWDPSLMFVMIGAVGVTLLGFQFGLRVLKKPLLSAVYELPKMTQIDKKVIIGPAIFGIGWGLSGFCPGPGMINMLISQDVLLYYIPGMIAGQYASPLLLTLL